MIDSSTSALLGVVLFVFIWLVVGNLLAMVLVLFIKPHGRNRFGKPGKPCTPVQSIQSCLSQYVSAAGRGSRSEVWWFLLAAFVVDLALNGLDAALNVHIFHYGSLAFTLPLICAQVRRLHDINRTGWWVLLNLTLFPVVLWVLFAQPAPKDEADSVAGVF